MSKILYLCLALLSTAHPEPPPCRVFLTIDAFMALPQSEYEHAKVVGDSVQFVNGTPECVGVLRSCDT